MRINPGCLILHPRGIPPTGGPDKLNSQQVAAAVVVVVLVVGVV